MSDTHMHTQRHRCTWAARAIAPTVLLIGVACNPNASDKDDGASPSAVPRNDLSHMKKATVTINGYSFDVWVAATPAERETGLMGVTADEMSSPAAGVHEGMLFIFERPQILSFWMKNTLIPLDIAFIGTDGRIVRTATMVANDSTRTYSSGMPARMALEVEAGLLHRLGIAAGDLVEIPDSLLKGNP